MNRTALVLALVSCAAAGCAAESQPPASAAPAPRRVVWQAFCEQAWNVPHLSALVAQRGADGWEIAAMYNGVVCYKRPAGDAPQPAQPRWTPAPQAPQPPTPKVPMWDPGF